MEPTFLAPGKVGLMSEMTDLLQRQLPSIQQCRENKAKKTLVPQGTERITGVGISQSSSFFLACSMPWILLVCLISILHSSPGRICTRGKAYIRWNYFNGLTPSKTRGFQVLATNLSAIWKQIAKRSTFAGVGGQGPFSCIQEMAIEKACQWSLLGIMTVNNARKRCLA